jgi:hypothetical protein
MNRTIILTALCILAAGLCGCGSHIGDIEVSACCDSATISWTTTNDSTAVIKFGETPFLGLKIYEDSEDMYDCYNSGAGLFAVVLLAMLEAAICGGTEEEDDCEDNPWEEDDEELYEHSVCITGLQPGTTYYFRIRTVDMDGCSRESRRRIFTTPWE